MSAWDFEIVVFFLESYLISFKYIKGNCQASDNNNCCSFQKIIILIKQWSDDDDDEHYAWTILA